MYFSTVGKEPLFSEKKFEKLTPPNSVTQTSALLR